MKLITLPRLELSAALLLVELIKHIKQALEQPDITVHCWTDSIIVLGWLNSEPSKYATFVANRVASVDRIIEGPQWHHVKRKP